MKKVCEMLAWYKILYYLCNREREDQVSHPSKLMKQTFEAMKKNQTNNSTNWKNEVNEIRARLEAVKTRSCWDRGVKGFALDLLESYENICEYCEHDGQPIPELNEETLLNGADDWRAYCYGGGALIYNTDIAKALCTPSMLKKKDGGRLDPNHCEIWMDVQVRAYYQAFRLLKSCVKSTCTQVGTCR